MIGSRIKRIAVASSLAVAFGVAGCESDNQGHAKGPHKMPDGTTMSGTDHALMCPKCETVWTTSYVDQGTKTARMVSKRSMVCPTCDKMAEAYMKDGEKVLHDCPDCKVTPTVLERKPSAYPRGPRG